MSSKAEIANMALSHIGVTASIQDLDAEKHRSKEAGVCALWLDIALEATLRAWDWPFATRVVPLALVAEQPNREWAYSYRYPSDCLKARRILGAERPAATHARIPFTVASDTTARLILTDEPQAELEYTARESDASRFDPLFTLALSWQLALHIALPLSKIAGAREAAQVGFADALAAARTAAANEQQKDLPPEPALIRARY